MTDRCYRALVRLHPRAFRERFGDEMLRLFEDERSWTGRLALFADAAVSVVRQHAFRDHEPEMARAAAVAGAPMFQVIESRGPRRSALMEGAALTVLIFLGIGFLAVRGDVGRRWRGFLVGSRHPRPQVLGVDRASIMAGGASAEIQVASPAADPLEPVARVYFKIIRVLDVLDADQDRAISAWEIVTAPKALLRLDRDNDGRLSPEECGFSLGSNDGKGLSETERSRAMSAFMRANPVLAALDRDGDGIISGDEIAASSASLRAMDRNGDGALSPIEVLPDAANTQAAMVLVKLDADADGRISPEERASYEGQEFRELLDRADRDGDGSVTMTELLRELRLRAEAARQLNAARRANGAAR